MESLFLLAFSEEEFLTALAIASSEAFFNKLLIGTKRSPWFLAQVPESGLDRD
jgi:hypothetical protein